MIEAEGRNILYTPDRKTMPGRRPPCSPSVSWGGSKRRSGPEHRRQGKQSRVRGHGSRVGDAGVLDVNDVVAALPQAPQDEAGPDSADFGCMELVVDETGLAAEEAVAHRSGPQQEISRVGAIARQPAPRTDLPREFSSEQRSLNNLRTVHAAEDDNRHEALKSQLRQFKYTKEGKLDYPAAPPTFHRENPRVTQKRHCIELPKLVEDYNLRAQQAAAAGARSLFRPGSRGGGKPNSRTLSTFLLAKKKFQNSPIPYKVPENYSRPPHPLDVGGKVSHVNICPVCEKYTVTELDRSAAACTVPSSSTGELETLRARFKCGLCREVFDLGIALFDPRGIPGVTLCEGEGRFRPPVPPRGKYPCPRCWKNTHTAFQCMAAYLREESKVPCEPACPAERLDLSSCNWGKPEEKETTEARNIIRTVLGLF